LFVGGISSIIEKGVPNEVTEEVVIEDKQQSNISPNYIDIFIPIDEGLIEKMKVADLRDELNIRELITRGKKHELQDRLKKALTDKVHVRKLKPQHKQQHQQQKSAVGKDFPITARCSWTRHNRRRKLLGLKVRVYIGALDHRENSVEDRIVPPTCEGMTLSQRPVLFACFKAR